MELSGNEVFLINVGLTLVLGMVIGAEREMRRKPAGMSTHSLVMGAAMLFSFLSGKVANADGARIAAQIVTGVGFIGAGIILHSSRGRVMNLTTAASVWFSAAVGMSVGFGFYFVAVVATVYAVIVSRIPRIRRVTGNN